LYRQLYLECFFVRDKRKMTLIPDGAKNALCFVVDSTGSMGAWLKALSEALPEVIDTALLTGAFSAVGVLAYGDYDGAWVVNVDEEPEFTYKHPWQVGRAGGKYPLRWSGWADVTDDAAVRGLRAMAAALVPQGGGGEPEALKTALWKLLKEAPADGTTRVHALVLTDASAHTGPSLDGEGQLEKKVLNSRFPMPALAEALAARGDLLKVSIITTASRFAHVYGGIAALTGGDLQQSNHAGSRQGLQATLSAWMGAADAPLGGTVYAAMPDLRRVTDDDLRALRATAEAAPVAARPELEGPLRAAVRRIRTDEAFVERLCVTLRRVVSEAPMALCGNAALGKLWRGFCARRQDPRRDEFLRMLDVAKNSLSAADRAAFDEWNKQSYDLSAEIRAELRVFAAVHGVQGLVRYSGGDDGFVPQSLNEVFLSLKREGVEQVAQFLARLSVDVDYALPPTAAVAADAAETGDAGDGGEEEPPLPWGDAALPLNLPDGMLFAVLLHVAVPGVRLSMRPAALLAGLAWRHGTVLKDRAAAHLEVVRGRWVNWERRDDADQTPVVQENYSANFLHLVAHTEPLLTEGERERARFMLRAAAALHVERLELRGVFEDLQSIDATLPDHVARCGVCGVDRALSLLAADGACGYCHRLRTPQGKAAFGAAAAATGVAAGAPGPQETLGGRAVPLTDTPAPPPSDAAAQRQVRCADCGGIFARDGTLKVHGAAKCHFCQRGLTPRTVQCAACQHPIVSDGHALPGGVCGPCAAGCAPRRFAVEEKPTPAREAFPLAAVWRELYAAAGLHADGPVTVTLPKAVLKFTSAAVVAAQPAPQPAVAPSQRWRLANAADLWAQLVDATARGTGGERPFCSLCCRQLAPQKVALACGRTACTQRICDDCGRAWYGRNNIGHLLVPRALLCPCCARTPVAKTLRRWNPDAHAAKLADALALLPADAVRASYLGWCAGCTAPREAGPRTCGDAAVPAPLATGAWTCEACETARALTEGGSYKLRKCPGCHAPTLRAGGCQHIACPCGVHWCYTCGEAHDDIYGHISAAHANGDYDEDPEPEAVLVVE